MDNFANNSNFSLRKLLLPFLLIVIFIFLSEIIFSYRNTSPYVLFYYLEKSKDFASKNDMIKAYSYLDRAAGINFRYSLRQYPSLVFSDYYINIDINSIEQETSEVFLQYLSNIEPDKMIISKEADMSKVFYDLALLAFRTEQLDLVEKFLRIAVYLEPELSHYHIELTNYYLVMDNKDKAKEAIEFCFKFTYPQKHCKEYMGDDINVRYTEEIGFLEKQIDRYYNSS